MTRKWKIILIVIAVSGFFGFLVETFETEDAPAVTTTATQPEATTTTTVPTTTTTEATAAWEAEVENAWAVDPASYSVVVTVTNVGDAPGSPECFVYVSNPSAAYTGSDLFWLEDELEPGDYHTGRLILHVDNDGANHITDVLVECE